MTNVVLYHTDGCHLCEVAKEKVQSVLAYYQEADIQLLYVDLIDDEKALQLYSLSIPVLKDAEGRELFPAFDVSDIVQFLNLIK
jgi:glutaredoxin